MSLYIDEGVWTKFREKVFRKHGSLRKLSNEVEALLYSSLVGETIKSGFGELGIKTKGIASSREVKENRPTLRGPASEEIVRAMRGGC